MIVLRAPGDHNGRPSQASADNIQPETRRIRRDCQVRALGGGPSTGSGRKWSRAQRTQKPDWQHLWLMW